MESDHKRRLQQSIEKVQKFKDLCRKHYYRADAYKTKHLEHEFEMRARIDQLENAMERINHQANINEQLRYQKQMLAEKYEARMSKIESIMEKIITSESRKNESNSSKQQMERFNQLKSHLEKDY